MKSKNKAGFTLIELLVVVLIIGILASVAIPQYFKVVERSRLSAPNSVFGGIGSAQESRLVRLGSYTNNWTELDQLYTATSPAVAPCAGAGVACIMGLFTYTINWNAGNDFYTITAVRTAPLSTKYGAYTVTYSVPGNTVTCDTADCTADLM